MRVRLTGSPPVKTVSKEKFSVSAEARAIHRLVHCGFVAARASVMQQKTKQPVKFVQ
jgi:hypothetical protein